MYRWIDRYRYINILICICIYICIYEKFLFLGSTDSEIFRDKEPSYLHLTVE